MSLRWGCGVPHLWGCGLPHLWPCGPAFLLALLLLAPSGASADSVFGIYPFGIPTTATDARGRAMGGTGIALPGEAFSPFNPALAAGFGRSGALALASQEWRHPRDGVLSASLRAVDFPLVHLVIPLPGRVALSAGVRPEIDLAWAVEDSVEFGGARALRRITSEGDLFVAHVGGARLLSKGIAVGGAVEFHRGSNERLLELLLQGVGLPPGDSRGTRDEYKVTSSGVGVRLGGSAQWGCLRVGGSVAPSVGLDIDQLLTVLTGQEERTTLTGSLPMEWGLGCSARLTGALLVAGEVRGRRWSHLEIGGESLSGVGDAWDLSLGAEYTMTREPLAPWWKRVPLRGGYMRRLLPPTVGGHRVVEQWGTAGTAFPFGGGRGELSLFLEVGKRGDLEANGLEETLWRVGVAIAAYEKWVPIERRRR